VRIDQYVCDAASVPPYHDERRAALALVPPSTSIIMNGLLTPFAHVSLEAIAMLGAASARMPVTPPAEVPAPRATSGFAPVLKMGEFIFIAGQIADSAGKGGIAREATTNPEFLWDGVEIKRQASYVLKNVIRSAEAAGSDREHMVKAQVYLRSIDDLPQFSECWRDTFGEHGPALTVIPATGIALRDGMIEVNMVCVERGVAIERKTAEADAGSRLAAEPLLVRAGDLAVCSGMMASQGRRLADGVAKASRDRYVRSVAGVEMHCIIDQVERALRRVGLGLNNLARIIQFQTDLGDFRAMAKAWHDRLGTPIPLTAVQVPGPLPVAGARVLVDCWAVGE
jgi:2-iminobutanoate/2-iminopropanoate deaminase